MYNAVYIAEEYFCNDFVKVTRVAQTLRRLRLKKFEQKVSAANRLKKCIRYTTQYISNSESVEGINKATLERKGIKMIY